MDEAMRTMEERLEALVPKGISDRSRERLEETIEGLAESAATRSHGGGAWKWGLGVAAGLGLMVGAQFLLRGPSAQPVVAETRSPEVVEFALAEDFVSVVETVMLSRQVEGRMDEGWVPAEGSPHVYRYWGYEVTDEEEVVDEETGYVVKVYSQREKRIPVRITSL
jgi:hypothetical protein